MGVRLMSAWVVGAIVVGTAWAQEPKQEAVAAEKTRAVKVSGMNFEVPESWKSVTPTGQMRRAQIQVPPIEGDKTGAELVLTIFPGGGGGVEANIERWRRQVTDEDGDPAEPRVSKVRGQNVDVTRVELEGTYKDPFAPGGPQPGHLLLGAMVMTDDSGYFLKMVGPIKTMNEARAGFDAMLKSIAIDGVR